MFERIKCYRRLVKADKFLRGVRKIGELIQNENIIQDCDDTLRKNATIKKQIWFNRQMAKDYNIEYIKNGFR